MDVDGLVRDPAYIHSALVENGDLLLAKKDLVIHIPKHWTEGALGSMESKVNALANYGIIVDGKYACSIACCIMTFTPETVNTITVDELPYLEMVFSAGTPILTIPVIKTAPLLYEINNEFDNKGKKPWYMNESDLARLFDTAEYHAGAGIGADRAITEMMVASRMRMPEDRAKYYKEAYTTEKQYAENLPEIIAGRSVGYGATNTSARLLGSYMSEGMTSALVNPTEKLEKVEALLIK